jgi:hypothetical protein
MSETVSISKDEYEELKHKSELLNEIIGIIEEEELTAEEIDKIKKAEKSPPMTEEEFLKNHPELRERNV